MKIKYIPLIIAFLFPLGLLSQGNLVWSDEFDGEGDPDPEKWEQMEYNRRINDNGPDGWWEKDDVYLDGNGNMVIRVRKIDNRNSDSDPYDYSVGAVRTKNLYEPLFGRFEIRCKLPRQQGWWVAFWMMQGKVSRVGDGGVDGVEVDIMEAWGWTDQVNHAFHWDGYGDDHKSTGEHSTVSGIRDGYHTYTLDWYPDEYIFYVDGEETWRNVEPGVCQYPGYIKVTGEISTNDWAINNWWAMDPADATYPDSFLVDYVRVYDLNLNEEDTEAPADPINITADASPTYLDLTWDRSEDNYAVKKYRIFQDDVLTDSTIYPEYKLRGLDEETEYTV